MIGNVEKELFHLKPYLLNPKIIFQDHVSQNRLRLFYNKSNIFVTSSLEELGNGSDTSNGLWTTTYMHKTFRRRRAS